MYEGEQGLHCIIMRRGRLAVASVVRIWIEKMPVVVIGLFLCALLTGIFLPIYSDEVVVKWSLARFFLEDGTVVSLLPQCTTAAGRVIAWVFYPAAMLLSTIYANLEPLGLRISGMIFSVIWFLLIAGWCFKQSCELKAATHRFAGLVAFASLGVMPYLWVLSRSEQILTLIVLVLCLSSLFFKRRKSIYLQSIVGLLLVVLLSCFFYAHPKSLFFVPFVTVAIWLTTEHYSRIIRYGLIGVVGALAFQVYRDSSVLGACQDAPFVQQMLTANTLLPGMLFSAPIDFILAALNNIISFPGRLLTHLVFSVSAQSGWLPPVTIVGNIIGVFNFVIQLLLLILVVGSHAIALLVFLYQMCCKKLSASTVLSFSLVVSDVVNIAFYNIQNFYAATQFIPLSIVVTMLLFGAVRIPKLAFTSYVYNFLLVAAVISMAIMFSMVTPSLIKNSFSDQSTVQGQPLSIPAFNIHSHLESIKKLGDRCELPNHSAKNVVVDHMTYFNYVNDKSPIHILYISELGFGGDLIGGKMLPLLKSLNSPGMIARCEWIPNEFRSVQQKDAMGYCCVNFKNL